MTTTTTKPQGFHIDAETQRSAETVTDYISITAPESPIKCADYIEMRDAVRKANRLETYLSGRLLEKVRSEIATHFGYTIADYNKADKAFSSSIQQSLWEWMEAQAKS